jgi:hypothetical protein
MGRPMEWDQWRGTFLGLGRSRGRELKEIQDKCRRIPVGCGLLSCERTVRVTLFLWIPSPT